ncbi:hypothetical protein BH09MYX1_BH09MYX1_05920 [soil metagenome]
MGPRTFTLFFLMIAACGGAIAPSSDGGTVADGSVDGPGTPGEEDGATCKYGPPATLSAQKICKTSADCAYVAIPTSCCQDVTFGVHVSYKDALAKDVEARTLTCPKCGCAAKPQDENGNYGVDFNATCDVGKCIAHAK